MITLLQIASNPALLKTRAGLQWLIGYSHATGYREVELVLHEVKWDMDMVLDEYHKQAQFLPPPAYRYSTDELPF